MTNQYNHTPQNSVLSIVSLVAGVAGWSIVPFFGALLAIITGHMAQREIRESQGQVEGKGLATAGLVLGYGCLGTSVLIVLVVIAVLVFGLNLSGFLN